MSKFHGLSFNKFDLHVHTPASHDFIDKAVTPEEVVEQAIKQGLRGIAITDHNTGDWIDKVKIASNGKELVVFPGVEIYCTGGKSGIHIIGLLDTDKGTKHIHGILSKLNISPDDFGTQKAVTEKSPYDVIDAITSPPYQGIAVLAHCTSSKGVLADITGETRSKIFVHPGLLAVETSTHDFTDATKISKKTRAIDLLNGEDPNFNNRRLAVYISSDSMVAEDDMHSLKGIGAKYTYMKVDDKVNLESLRQCFIDREVRIRQHFEFKENAYPYIMEVSVKGGFFDNEVAEFHKGLNSILGGKGAGKSMLVELIRFALAKETSQNEILLDHQSKLENKLQTYGSVTVKIIDETGVKHTIERTYDPSAGNPFVSKESEHIANMFSMLILSQNEIIKIAENENEQIEFIDRFFDFQNFKDRIKNVQNDLKDLDRQFAKGLTAISGTKDITEQKKKYDLELERITKLFKDPIFSKYKELEAKDLAIKKQIENSNSLKNYLENQLEGLATYKVKEIEGPLSADSVIKRNHDTFSNTLLKIETHYEAAFKDSKDALKKIQLEYKNWETGYSEKKKKYQEHIRVSGGDKKELERKRVRTVKMLDDLNKRLDILKNETKALKLINENRESRIKQLFEIYEDYSSERKQKCSILEQQSRGRLKIHVHESTNSDAFKNKLSKLKKGSYLKDSEIEAICGGIKPYNFILEILRYDASKDISKLNPISTATKLDIERVKSLSDYLLNEVNYETLLHLQYEVHPQDKPEIQYRLVDGKYELIKNVSVGQKCTAMLIMALSDGNFPILIDQPEDSLDVRTVWEDMCMKIRRGKNQRQFIFTTHNSSLAVASDTDKYLIIESNSLHANIEQSGALDAGEIKEEVIKYLEGGRSTYSKKAKKYGM